MGYSNSGENKVMSYQWDNKKPTAQMLGRWQPFHDGHYALFEEIVKKTGQVCIQVRDVQGVDDNPFNFDTVKNHLKSNIAVFGKQNPIYKGKKITPRYIWKHFSDKRITNMFSESESRYFFHNAFSFFLRE